MPDYTQVQKIGHLAMKDQKSNSASEIIANTKDNNQELYRLKSSRLADFFPNELIIQDQTVSVIKNNFLNSQVETIPIRDIGRVIYIDTPFFAGLEILGKNTAHDLKLKGLIKRDAQKAKQIIEGLLLETQSDDNTTDYLKTQPPSDS